MIAVASRPRRLRLDRRTVLYLYTALEIAGGSLALAWAAIERPLTPAISFTGDGRPAALWAGVAFWCALALLGGSRVGSIHGYGVLTFHMPFIVAAAALGGPAAGGIVAFIGSLELRELREPPWYGLLANHAALALGGVVAGLVMALATDRLAPLGLGPEPTALLAFVLGATAFVVISVSLATATSILRDALTPREVIAAYTGAFRATMVTEVVVGWLLALTYRMVGWWAPVVAAIAVLQLIRLIGEREYVKRDPNVPGLVTYPELQSQTESAAHLWPIGYLIVTIEGWKTYVDAYGREAAGLLTRRIDEAIVEVKFLRDFAARSGEGEWRILLVNIRLDGALTAALKVRRAVSGVLLGLEPEDLADDGQVDGGRGVPRLRPRIGVGVVDDPDRGGTKAIQQAEQAIFHAQREPIAIVIRTEDSWLRVDQDQATPVDPLRLRPPS